MPYSINEMKTKLASYVKGWTAYSLLKQDLINEAQVTISEYPAICAKVRLDCASKTPPVTPNISHIISELISNTDVIKWQNVSVSSSALIKNIAITFNGQVYNVIIKKPEPEKDEYEIDVIGEVQDDLSKFQHTSVCGKTVIKFEENGQFVITPGDDEKLKILSNSQRAARPLQLNTVRKFAEGINSTTDPQNALLGLLGTGTGKSFVIAHLAEAIGSSVIVVPSVDLAKEIINDAIKIKIFGGSLRTSAEGIKISIGGSEITVNAQSKNGGNIGPFVVLASELPEDDYGDAIIKELLKRNDIHIVMPADSKRFSERLNLIKDQLLLIDESHQHAYTSSEAAKLKLVCSQNVTLALTGTPTGHLLGIFPPKFIEFNLHDAIAAGALRNVDGKDVEPSADEEWSEDDMVDKAIVAYFRIPAELESSTPCKKSMIFSDDKAIRDKLKVKLTNIANGTMEGAELSKYKGLIKKDRRATEEPDLKNEMDKERVSSLKNTIISMAISLLYDKPLESLDDISLALRDKKLCKKTTDKAKALKGDIETRLSLLTSLAELPTTEQDYIKQKIKELAIKIDGKINADPKPDNIQVVLDDMSADIAALEGDLSNKLNTEPYFVTAKKDPENDEKITATQRLALLRCGFANGSISDSRWATGVSITDVKAEISVNPEPHFDDDFSLAGPLTRAQALGRVVRSKDGVGQSTTIWGPNVPECLRFRTSDVLDSNFGDKATLSLQRWDSARETYRDTLVRTICQEKAYTDACAKATAVAESQEIALSPPPSAGALRREASVGAVDLEITGQTPETPPVASDAAAVTQTVARKTLQDLRQVEDPSIKPTPGGTSG